MIAYFCTTPYQILTACHLAFTELKDEKIDLYVLNHFNDAEIIAERLSKQSLFSNVKYVDCIGFSKSFSKNTPIRFAQKIYRYLSYKRITRSIVGINNEFYNDVYFAYPDVITQLALKTIYKNNNSVKVHLTEDGLGAYLPFIEQTTTYKKLFNKLTSVDKVLDNYDSLRVYMPELMHSSSFPIKKIEPIDIENLKFREIVNSVFDYKKGDEIEEKLIYFEQPFTSRPGLDNAIARIIDEILINDYIVKLHPRSQSNKYINHNQYHNHNLPWEVIVMNSEIENKVLLSYYSTVSLSPKFMFDEEPYIIYLFEIPELKKLNEIDQELTDFISKFKGIYTDNDKIFIPKSIDELISLLSKLAH